MRFYLMSAFEAPEHGGQRIRLHAGQCIADHVSNALPGDVICPWLCANPTRAMIALDSTALGAMWGAGFTEAQVGKALCGVPTGAESIR
jgi:hypothetical protein